MSVSQEMDVKVKLENLICSVLNIPSRSIKENERLLEDIGINSIDLIKIIVNIEHQHLAIISQDSERLLYLQNTRKLLILLAWLPSLIHMAGPMHQGAAAS